MKKKGEGKCRIFRFFQILPDLTTFLKLSNLLSNHFGQGWVVLDVPKASGVNLLTFV